MKRIGIAASLAAKDNITRYNILVVVYSVLFSLLIFFCCGFVLIAGLALIAYATKGFLVIEPKTGFSSIVTVCLMALAVVIGLVNLAAILVNIKLKK
ncbi:MAG: hypothetical protein HQL19_08565 [Candidatus Omnitrophica bacterium]|nr:hypothetical protein [Candidatus Omnitrophota bacterium]